MGYTLILCEKPTASKAVAEALADGKPTKKGEENSRATWYEFSRDGQRFVVAPAVGHLFTLKQTDKGWAYPAFNVDWIPSYKANKFAAFSEPYFRNIENLAKDAKDVIVATDYDDEGEVIAFNILRFLLGRKDALRMRFSTMTKEELIGSYEHAMKHLNKNLIESGLARHYLDYYWGISLSRALTNAIKVANKRFRILSTGRVQGPTLHLLAKHEKKIKAFKSKPFWEIELDVQVGKQVMKARHAKDKFWSKDEAESVLSKVKNKDAVIRNVKKKIMTQKPPKPYNTTSLLADIYRYFGYSPQQGMAIAEALYQAALISYPRTSSEKLPPDINYKKIISALRNQKSYEKDAVSLLSGMLKPEEGARTDAAHPAIYPTGEYKRMGDKQQKVYDLVVRRFLACFGAPAKRESQRIELDVAGEIFFFHGTKTIEAGWTALYGKYAQREEILLPKISAADRFDVKKSEALSKETQPPPRFSQGSVLKEMEQKSLGTKSTRSQILQILYNRGYIIGKSIEVTELGSQLVDILEKNVPDVVSERLTSHFEELTDSIETGKVDRETVMAEARDQLVKTCDEFRKKEKKIGEELTKAVIATQDKQSILGTCIKCSGTLKVHKMWRTGKRFVGCSGYKKGCRVGFPLPREGVIMSTEKICEECKTPIIQVFRQAARPFRMCLDITCPTKKDWLDKSKLAKAKQESRAATKLAEQLKCDCGKSFKSKRALTLHKKTHKTSE
ncbi:MAG: DNA topoisomerase I [Candidatus Aenigmarchaeota archaeon]|nr:DNA topoisomerase I [Candidatus Aenigmarchaeota archaeon]